MHVVKGIGSGARDFGAKRGREYCRGMPEHGDAMLYLGTGGRGLSGGGPGQGGKQLEPRAGMAMVWQVVREMITKL